MYGRRSQRKRGLRRAVVTLLALVLLVSVCFPGLRASANGEKEPTYQITVNGEQTSTITGTEGSDHTWTSGDEYNSVVTMETADNVATLTAVNAGSVTITHEYNVMTEEGTISPASDVYIVSVSLLDAPAVVSDDPEDDTEPSTEGAEPAEEESTAVTTEPVESTAETETVPETTAEAETEPLEVETYYEVQCGSITVSAVAPAGSFTETVTMRVTELAAGSDAYQQAESALSETTEYDEMRAYDISFYNDNGELVEPQADSQVSISISAILEDADIAENSVQIAHISESSGAAEAVIVADETNATSGTVVVEETAVQADFTVESFSTFTLSWNNNKLAIICIDANGTEIGSDSNGNISSATAVSVLAPSISGYTFSKAVLAVSASVATTSTTEVTYLQKSQQGQQSQWQYSANGTNYSNIGNNNSVYFIYAATEEGEEDTDLGGPITFVYYSQSSLDANPDSLKAPANTVKFTVNLLDEDGNLTTFQIPDGATIPASYTSASDEVSISELLSQISVPGYTLEGGYAFFFWGGNQAVTDGKDLANAGAHKVTSFKNFTVVSNRYGDGSSRLGTTSSTNTYHTIGYTMTELDGTAMSTDDWTSSPGYYAYEYGGVLHIVLMPVSEQVTYKTRWINYAETEDTLVDTTNAHNMIYTDSTGWTGKLALSGHYNGTGLTSPGAGYVFDGWYFDCDENGNGTGTKVIGNEIMYSDNTVYARWVLSTTTITLKKIVKGNMGDYGKEFAFTIDAGDDTPTTATVNDDTVSVTGGSISLSHNGVATFTVPIGTVVTITETSGDYSVSAEVTNGSDTNTADNVVTFTASADGNTVTFTNTKNADIDTGVTLDSAPYIFLTVLALGGTVLLMKRRRVI